MPVVVPPVEKLESVKFIHGLPVIVQDKLQCCTAFRTEMPLASTGPMNIPAVTKKTASAQSSL